MNRFITTLLMTFLCLFLVTGNQGVLYAQDTDTLDVAEGYETLNLAVEGDTLADGSPKNVNRVYRLARGGLYLLNGTITGNGAPLRIVAAKGDGPKPLLISTADEGGSSSRYFRPGVDAEWKGLYLSGIDNLGNLLSANAQFRLGKEGGRYIIDNCVLDGDDQSFIRMDAADQSLFVTNSIMFNSFRIASTGNGRFIDTRGNTIDTIFVQNSTFFNNIADAIRNGGGIIKYFVWDHVTTDLAIAWGAEFDIYRNVYCRFTNSLLLNTGWEGRDLMSVDSTGDCIFMVDSLFADDIATEEQRDWYMANNVMGWSPEIKTWITSQDSLQLYPWIDAIGEYFFGTFDNFVMENNLLEDVEFSDGPELTQALAWMEHRATTDHGDENNPDIRLDRNGVASFENDPELNTFGPADDDYDFDYAASFAAYTHAEGGFPAGDLNWFPDKKAEWEGWVTSVGSPVGIGPKEFNLAQNYPNPFNPTTTITYDLTSKDKVSLIIYNMLGQKVRTLVDKNQVAGRHQVTWNGRDDSGTLLPTGMYVYRLESAGQSQARKMLLIK